MFSTSVVFEPDRSDDTAAREEEDIQPERQETVTLTDYRLQITLWIHSECVTVICNL